MKKYILCFLLQLLFSSVNAQEKRLALVIGNENYDKGSLKNPVNDALLMKETLEKLNFEVMLDTNLRTRNDLLNSINSFGEKRKNYNIGLVYYAGHGVQLNGKNYLLATKERYETKLNIEDNGVNVGRILDFFELAKNEINILVLDACRNNPFEKNWVISSRSLDDGLGLAPLSSSGNIIAFSTSAGTTASDGNEKSKNSNYCLSLVKNMMTPDLDLDQIFRNVRKEVREVSNGNQLPTVDNHYEGSDFYFIKSTYIDQINQIDSLIDVNDYDLALEKVTFILTKSPNNKLALLRRGRIEYNKKNKDYDGFHLYKADSLYPKDSQVLEYLGRYYSIIGEIEKAIGSIDLAIKIDNANPQLYYWKARFFEEKNEIEKAEIEYTHSIMIESSVSRFVERADFFFRFNKYLQATSDYTKAIDLDKENSQWYEQRANCFLAMEDYTSSLKDLDKAIELAPNEPYYYNNRADFYRKYKQEDDLALKDYSTAIKLSSDSYQTTRALNNRALIFEKQEQYDLAIEEYTKALELAPMESVLYSNRANIYKNQKKYELALVDIIKSIELDKENPQWYEQRANCYLAMEDYTSSLKDLDKAIDLAPNDSYYFNMRADFYREYKQEDDLALKDYAKAIKLSSDSYQTTIALNNRALIFEKQERYDLAIEEYTKALELAPMESLYYSNRANVYKNQEKYEFALADYTKSIEMDKENPQWYEQRADCYLAMEDYTSSLKDLDKAIDLAPNDSYHFNNRADFYREYKQEDDLALKDYLTAIKLSSDSYQTTRALNNRALIFEKQEQNDLAIEEYTKALELAPMESLYYSNRANVYKNQEKYEFALADYTKSIELDKENPQWYEQRANCYLAMEDYTSSLKDLDKAIDLAPNDSYYFNNRADFYREYKQEDDLALKDYSTAIKLSSDSYQTTKALNNRALIFDKQEQYDLAIEEYTKALEITPLNSRLYSNRANVYKNQKKYELALADIIKSIELDKENPQCYEQRGEFNENFMNKPYDALIDYSLAISLDSSLINNWWHRGKLFSEKLNNQQLAILDFDQILKIEPNNINALNWRTIFYDRNNDIKNAIRGYQKIISFGDSIKKLDYKLEDYGWANINLALIYQCENKIEEALSLFNEGINYMPDNAEGYYYRSWFFSLYLLKYDEAIKDFSSSINFESKNPYWYLNRSKIYQLMGEQKKAKNDLDEAVKISAESAIYLAERGNFYSISGEYEKAKKDFKESFRKDTTNRRLYHFITEDLIRQHKFDEAIKNASITNELFKYDTVSFEQLGRIYLTKNDFYNSLSSYLQAAFIMEFNEGDRTIYPNDIQVFLSDIYIKIGEIYRILNQNELKCKALKSALDNIKYETRPDRQTTIKLIEEKIKNCLN